MAHQDLINTDYTGPYLLLKKDIHDELLIDTGILKTYVKLWEGL